MACHIRLLLCSAAILVHTAGALAQTKPAAPKKKTYCNPLVSGQPSTKRLSLQLELQPVHKGATLFQGIQPLPVFNTSSPAQSIRLTYNKNLVTKPKLYMTFAASYWFSSINVTNAGNNSFARLLDNSRFHSLSVSSNIFKPLNGKNFLLVNISAEVNGNASSFENFSGDNLLAGGAIIYGWKKGFSRMWGLGVFRGYRLGKVIHVPALLYNQAFNKKWGVDALIPARANFRYRPAASVLWQFGYELEGTQFAISSNNNFYNRTFFQRGEIRPKIGMEKQFKKNWAFTWNAGLRLNGRFDVSSDYNGKQVLAETNPRPSLFVNAGVHVVNFVKKKKK